MKAWAGCCRGAGQAARVGLLEGPEERGRDGGGGVESDTRYSVVQSEVWGRSGCWSVDRQGTGLSITGTLGQEETDMGPAREAGWDGVLGSSLTASERPGAGCGRGAASDRSQEGPGPRSKLPTRPAPRWTLQGLLVSSANEGNV